MYQNVIDNLIGEHNRKIADEEFNQIFNAAADGMCVIDKHFNILRINRTLSILLGISSGAKGKKCYEVLYSDMCHTPSCPLVRILCGEERIEHDVEKKHSSGTKISCILTATPLCGINGEVTGIIEDFKDISDRKRIEAAHREAEERLKIIWNNVENGIIIIDKETHVIVDTNPVAVKMIGAPKEHIVGSLCHKYICSADEGRCPVTDFGQHFSDLESILYRSNGKKIPILKTIVSIKLNGKEHLLESFFDITEAKRRTDQALKYSLMKLRKTLGGIINSMALTVEIRDPYTAGHQRRVTDLARAIAKEMCLSNEQIDGLRMAGVIHDIGKISVPAELLSKPGRISKIEKDLMKIHPQAGYDILKQIEFPWPVAQIVYQHHERLDGTGYPLGITGEKILMEAKILAVADVVEAMASHRPYRPSLGIKKALEEISQYRGIRYDSKVVDICLELFAGKSFKFKR